MEDEPAPSEPGQSEPAPSQGGPQEIREEKSHTRINFIISRIQFFYRKNFYWETFKSVIFFLLALKVASECYHIVIPIRDYRPFRGGCGVR